MAALQLTRSPRRQHLNQRNTQFTIKHGFGIVDSNMTYDFTVILQQGNADEALVAAAALTREMFRQPAGNIGAASPS